MEKNKARKGYGDRHGWRGFMVVNREWQGGRTEGEANKHGGSSD